MIEDIAVAALIAMIAEMRVAIHKVGKRVAGVEKRQDAMERMHVLPAVLGVLALCMLTACGGIDSPRAEGGSGHGSTVTAFHVLGNYLVGGGGILVAVGILGFLFAWRNPAAALIGKIALVGIEGGAAITAIGGMALWVSDNIWILFAGAAGVGVIWVWYRWNSIRRWLARRKTSGKET